MTGTCKSCESKDGRDSGLMDMNWLLANSCWLLALFTGENFYLAFNQIFFIDILFQISFYISVIDRLFRRKKANGQQPKANSQLKSADLHASVDANYLSGGVGEVASGE